MNRKFEVIEEFKNHKINLPVRQTTGSAGYDIASLEHTTIKPGELKLVKTGLKVMIPSDEVLLVYARSSLGLKKTLMMSNGVGVIDSDYYNNVKNEGHILVPLYNFGNKISEIEAGERIAQGIFTKFFKVDEEKNVISQRKGGFGSSKS